MSRITYGEYDDPVARFWEANAKRALKSKPGQKALREIEAALLAMPKKRLIKDEWAFDGEVCTLAAVDVYRHMVNTGASWESARLVVEHTVEEDRWFFEDPEIDYLLRDRLGYSRTLIWEVMEKNDERFEHCAPEERWQKMLDWVRRQLLPGEARPEAPLMPVPYGVARAVVCGRCSYQMALWSRAVPIYPAMEAWQCEGCGVWYCSQCDGQADGVRLRLEPCERFNARPEVE